MNLILPFALIAIVWFSAIFESKKLSHQKEKLIVWSVGQGQMITYVTPSHCHHFDMGGENFPKKKIFKICRSKKNQVRYSHWDLDHINFSSYSQRIFPSLCRAHKKTYLPKSKRKLNLIQKIPVCKKITSKFITEVKLPDKANPKTSNEKSRIFIIKKQILIPGDSTQKMEKFWVPLIKDSIQLLILGHHGSKSSTSHLLLDFLPHINIAIASSRKKKYSHPHEDVKNRLKKKEGY